MKITGASAIATAVAAFSLGGCGESVPMNEGDMPDMPTMGSTGTDGEHLAIGTVNSIDIEGGTIDISHGPIESVGWPAMTMPFRLADPDLASRVEPGQQIEFRFTTEDGGTVTAIERRP